MAKTSTPRFWKPEDIAYLRTHLQTMPWADIAAHVKRTERALECKAASIGINRPPRRAPLREAVHAALVQHGPLSITDLALHMHWEREAVENVIRSTRSAKPGQIFRIVGQQWRDYGQGREIPIYAAEVGQDEPRKSASKRRHAAQKRAHYHRNSARINAKARAARGQAGETLASTNPWLQLAPVEMRAVMSRIRTGTDDVQRAQGSTT